MFECHEHAQAKFDIQKLRWLNAPSLVVVFRRARSSMPYLGATGIQPPVPAAYLDRVLDLYRIRLKTLSEFPAMTDCFPRRLRLRRGRPQAPAPRRESRPTWPTWPTASAGLTDFSHAAIEEVFRRFAEEPRPGQGRPRCPPPRMAVSGKTKGAGLFEMMEVLGRERVSITRMRSAANG